MLRALVLALALVSISPAAARAEVVSASDGSFLLRTERDIAAEADAAWRALARVDRWWNPSHTFSGEAGNLSLAPRAGGCFCERWRGGQSVEHARVVMVTDHEGARTLRLLGGLGPLQEMGAVGVLTFTVAPHASGAKLSMSYRVSGEPGLDLATLAPVVDQVLMEQFARWARYSETGAPG